MAQNLQVLVSFSCYIIFFIRKQTKGWCFSFFQLLPHKGTISPSPIFSFSFFQLLRSPSFWPQRWPRACFSFFQLLHIQDSIILMAHGISFSFFQLLQAGLRPEAGPGRRFSFFQLLLSRCRRTASAQDSFSFFQLLLAMLSPGI